MAAKECTIGIDVGGTNTQIGIVDREGRCIDSTTMPTYAHKDVSFFMPRLFSEIDSLLNKQEDGLEVSGVGIGAPNANYYTGAIEKPANLQWGQFVPFVDLMKEHYPELPISITNDANAAAIGEMKFGAAKGMSNFVVVTLGTGLGSGIVVNGQLLLGHDGFAGELGHVLVRPNEGRVCGNAKSGTARKGCLEAYVSATGIKRTVYKLLADMTEPSMLHTFSFDELTAKMITDAARKGDPVALEAFNYTARILGMKLADTVAILSPEAIILFGGLSKAGDYLVKPVQEYMEHFMFPIFKGKVKLLVSDLQGENTAILGAAALAWDHLDRSRAGQTA